MTANEIEDMVDNLATRSAAISHVLDDLDRIQGDEKRRCREVALAITKLEEAQMWLEHRGTALDEEIEDDDGNGD